MMSKSHSANVSRSGPSGFTKSSAQYITYGTASRAGSANARSALKLPSRSGTFRPKSQTEGSQQVNTYGTASRANPSRSGITSRPHSVAVSASGAPSYVSVSGIAASSMKSQASRTGLALSKSGTRMSAAPTMSGSVTPSSQLSRALPYPGASRLSTSKVSTTKRSMTGLNSRNSGTGSGYTISSKPKVDEFKSYAPSPNKTRSGFTGRSQTGPMSAFSRSGDTTRWDPVTKTGMIELSGGSDYPQQPGPILIPQEESRNQKRDTCCMLTWILIVLGTIIFGVIMIVHFSSKKTDSTKTNTTAGDNTGDGLKKFKTCAVCFEPKDTAVLRPCGGCGGKVLCDYCFGRLGGKCMICDQGNLVSHDSDASSDIDFKPTKMRRKTPRAKRPEPRTRKVPRYRFKRGQTVMRTQNGEVIQPPYNINLGTWYVKEVHGGPNSTLYVVSDKGQDVEVNMYPANCEYVKGATAVLQVTHIEGRKIPTRGYDYPLYDYRSTD